MFSELLKDLRAKKHYSQKQLAEIVGVSPGNVSDWESGKTKPGYAALAALARCFEISADDLLELPPQETGGAETELRRLDEIREAHDESPFSSLETDLIAMFRLLPLMEKESVFDFVYSRYKRCVEKKRDSIFWTYADGNEKENGPAESREPRGGTA